MPLVLQLSNGWGSLLHFFYKALTQPHFDSYIVVWGSCGIKLADKLQKLQNSAARALTFSSYDAEASQLFQNLNWNNLSTQLDIQRALMVFKSLNGLAPEYLSSTFIARSNTTSHTFRDYVNKLTIQFHRHAQIISVIVFATVVLFCGIVFLNNYNTVFSGTQ